MKQCAQYLETGAVPFAAAMPQATSDWILGEFERAKTLYPAFQGKTLSLADEPAGDFGVAHFYGVTADDVIVLTFDSGYRPGIKTVWHEFGHALQSITDGETFPDLWSGSAAIRGYWTARRFPGTPADSDRRAQELGAQGKQFESWQHWATEIFAEGTSVASVPGTGELTATYGVPPPLDAMRAYLSALRDPDKEDTVTDDEFMEKIGRLYGPRLQQQLNETVYDPLNALAQRVDAITAIGEHTHETPPTRTGGPVPR